MTLRLLRLLIIAGPGVAGLVFGQPAKDAAGALTATAKITEMKFCLGTPNGEHFATRELAPDAISLNLGLRVSYRNAGVDPVILLLVGNWHVVISHSLEDAAHRRDQLVIPYYEYNPAPPWGPGDLPALDAERPEPNLFRIIPPSKAWTDTARISFQVHKPSVDGTGSELLGKRVFFQLVLDHALLAENVERALQVRWHRYGTLWAGTTRTQPIELNIPKSPQASQCLSNRTID